METFQQNLGITVTAVGVMLWLSGSAAVALVVGGAVLAALGLWSERSGL